jgi:NADPH-dependent 2,4-dienoyl-CoA reductase/sulfur reductase-like enzyme
LGCLRHFNDRVKTRLFRVVVPGFRSSIPSVNMGKQEFDARPSVIVVGAGAGGVATAARLAAAGCKVTLVEKNDFSGGRCSLIHRDGYVWHIFML